MVPVDFKEAINQDIKEIDLALSVLNSLKMSTWPDSRCFMKLRREMQKIHRASRCLNSHLARL